MSVRVCRQGRVFSCGRDEGEGRLGVTHAMITSDRLLNFFLQVCPRKGSAVHPQPSHSVCKQR